MPIEILQGLAIPFLGTTLGAALSLCCVGSSTTASRRRSRLCGGHHGRGFGLESPDPLDGREQRARRLRLAAGRRGLLAGTLFLLLLDHIIPHLHLNSDEPEGPKSALSKNLKLVLAVTLHNIPEGMAVGVVLAGWLTGGADLSLGAALALSLGIAIQNFPEGAIISLPLATNGEGRARAFVLGTLSGIVEPIGGALTIVAASVVVPVLPYLLAFAAGAMLYVVVEELIPEMSAGHHSNIGVVAFSVGFTLMMALDTILG